LDNILCGITDSTVASGGFKALVEFYRMVFVVTRVLRGGSWFNNWRNTHSAFRNGDVADDRGDNLGFRLVRELD